ncbi:MAG: DUF4437 domain-containing protein [Planctomycetota bacterium]
MTPPSNIASLTAFKDLRLEPRFEGDELKVAVLWGDPASGPVAIMLHMPKGHVEPFHKHTSDYHCVVVEGRIRTQMKNVDRSEEFGPGSHIFQPGGTLHAESSSGDRDLLALVYFDGPIDVIHDE